MPCIRGNSKIPVLQFRHLQHSKSLNSNYHTSLPKQTFMAKNTINHISHPGHPLKPVDSNQEFLCDGCKTLGTGRRYSCNGCDFDLHHYCGTCPRVLSASLHHHTLDLVTQNPKQTHRIDRICDVCREPVKGLFYRCKECEFYVHPLCTQLPEKLHHVLHKTHPLVLQSSSVPNFCGVCRNSCTGWRYRCEICNFGIHLECVLAPMVPSPQHEQISQRGTSLFGQRAPFQPPPQFAPYYNFPHGAGYPNFGPGFNPYHGGPHIYQPQNLMPQNYEVGSSNSNNGTAGQLRKSMFSLVGQLGFGVLSNMIFGVDISSQFAG